jgi:alkylated DNA repair dioxygenase AlkB
MPDPQLDIFGAPPPAGPALPNGFRYQADLVAPADERALVAEIAALPFREFLFHGYTGKRRVVSFGWRYDFDAEALRPADPMPLFLLALRDRAAAFAGLAPERLAQALVTEYAAGAAIGWHRDKGVFGDVVGVSLLAACTFRLRRAGRRAVGARVAHRRAALGVPARRRGAHGVGAQHPGGRGAALLGHVPHAPPAG